MNKMTSTRVTRRIDDIGRIVIPKKIRQSMDWHVLDELEFFLTTDGQAIMLRKPVSDQQPKQDATNRNHVLDSLSANELLELLLAYDRYIQDANDEDKFFEGWRPVCIQEFLDCDVASYKK